MMPRSRSQGRDLTMRPDLATTIMTSRPRTADTEQRSCQDYSFNGAVEDNISRDSGQGLA